MALPKVSSVITHACPSMCLECHHDIGRSVDLPNCFEQYCGSSGYILRLGMPSFSCRSSDSNADDQCQMVGAVPLFAALDEEDSEEFSLDDVGEELGDTREALDGVFDNLKTALPVSVYLKFQ